MQSYILDFRKSPSFMKKWNKEFDVEEISNNCFNIIILDDLCDNNIKDCLNNDSQLKYTDEELQLHSISETCSLEYVELDPDDLTNEDSQIIISDDVTFDLGMENFAVKGIFLTTDNGYVMAYVIHSNTINVTNQMIFEKDLVVIDVMEGVLNG